MTCAVCGAENQSENRPCRVCGTPLSPGDAKLDREPKLVECPSCGDVSQPGRKFCGMCGQRLDARINDLQNNNGLRVDGSRVDDSPLDEEEATQHRLMRRVEEHRDAGALDDPADLRTAPAAASRQAGVASPERRAHLQPDEAVSPDDRDDRVGIGGPSFLGLSSDSEDSEDYLFDDERPSIGLRSVLVLLIVAVIAGLVFVQWKASHKAAPSRPDMAISSPAGALQDDRAEPSHPAAAEHSPSTNPDNSEKDNQKSEHSNVQNGVAKDAPKTAADQQQAARELPPQPAATKNGSADDKHSTAAAQPAGIPDKEGRQIANASVKKAASGKETNGRSAATDTVAKEVDEPVKKEQPNVALVKAQQYLQGHGVRRNCEQGLIYLHVATRKNDPHAAVQMAALYASGHCVRQNRVEAYRWFVSAKEMGLKSAWIEQDLNQLWAKMTPAERERIGR
jgi:TPR repeat protein